MQTSSSDDVQAQDAAACRPMPHGHRHVRSGGSDPSSSTVWACASVRWPPWDTGRTPKARSKNPLNSYTPTSHDVFVAAHVKSVRLDDADRSSARIPRNGEYDAHSQCRGMAGRLDVPGPMTHYADPHRRPVGVDGVAGTEEGNQDAPGLRLAPATRRMRATSSLSAIRKDVFVSSYFFFVKHGPFQLHAILRGHMARGVPLVGHGRLVVMAGEHGGLLGRPAQAQRLDRSFQVDERICAAR